MTLYEYELTPELRSMLNRLGFTLPEEVVSIKTNWEIPPHWYKEPENGNQEQPSR